jgi:hypothetical protein
MAFTSTVLDVLVFWTWLATMPATFCWSCVATFLWASLATDYYAMCVPWCILHLAFYIPKYSLALSSGPRPLKRPSLPAGPSPIGNDTPLAAAPSLLADPVAVQQQHHINDESDIPAGTAITDTSLPTKLKAGATAHSDDTQGLQDTTTAAGPPTPTAARPSTPPAALPPTPTTAASPTPTGVAVPANPTAAGAPPAAAPEMGVCDKHDAIMATVIRFNREARRLGLNW